MTINDRFKLIIDKVYGGNKRAFSIAIGVNPTVTENIVGSRQGKPSYDLLCKVSSKANISEEWLLMGQGEMIKKKDSSQHISQISVPIIQKVTENVDTTQDPKLILSQTRPRIPYRAAAGSLSIAINSVAEDDCERIPLIPTFPKYDFTIIAKGESMSPDIQSGDELACRFITESSFIQWGRPHVIDTAQGIVVKRLYDGGDNIICRSCNKEHDDFLVPKDEIYHIALVVGLLRQY